jgi:ankyrin repeat protein
MNIISLIDYIKSINYDTYPRDFDNTISNNSSQINSSDLQGNTPLHLIIVKSIDQLLKVRMLEELLKYNPNINARNKLGVTPLHLAVSNEEVELVNYLINDSRIDTNIKNIRNQTPYDIIKLKYDRLLIKHGDEYKNIKYYNDYIRFWDKKPEFRIIKSIKELLEPKNININNIILNEECSICLQPMSEGNICINAKNGKCRHSFHCKCLVDYEGNNIEFCPLCKRDWVSIKLNDSQRKTLLDNNNKSSFGKAMNINQLNSFQKYLNGISINSFGKKKKRNNPVPKNKKLYNRIKNKIKRTAKVWPSRYTSWQLTKEYTRLGGKYY